MLFLFFFFVGVLGFYLVVDLGILRENLQRTWAEICSCLGCLQLFWPRVVMRKWLNISTKDSDFSADTDEDDIDGDSDTEGQFNGHNFKPPFFVFSVIS